MAPGYQPEQLTDKQKALGLVSGHAKDHNDAFKLHFYDDGDLFNQETEAMPLKKKQPRTHTEHRLIIQVQWTPANT